MLTQCWGSLSFGCDHSYAPYFPQGHHTEKMTSCPFIIYINQSSVVVEYCFKGISNLACNNGIAVEFINSEIMMVSIVILFFLSLHHCKKITIKSTFQHWCCLLWKISGSTSYQSEHNITKCTKQSATENTTEGRREGGRGWKTMCFCQSRNLHHFTHYIHLCVWDAAKQSPAPVLHIQIIASIKWTSAQDELA